MRASLHTNSLVPIGTTAVEERGKFLRQKITEHLDDCVDECVPLFGALETLPRESSVARKGTGKMISAFSVGAEFVC